MDQPSSIKEINQLRILNLLRFNPGISRVELAGQTGLGKATVSNVVSELINEGVVYEDGTGPQAGPAGRRPIRLRLNGEFQLAIGAELTGNECIAALTDLYATPLRFVRYPVPDTSVETCLNVLAQAVYELMAGEDVARLLGVGVGLPGPVDEAHRLVIQAENIGWLNIPLAALLEKRIARPVTVIKRTNAGALGEYWYGAGKNHHDQAYISIGLGIGSGLILGGGLYEGANGSAGEIGHLAIVPQGRRCKCGKQGCLETVASSPAMAQRARQKLGQGSRPGLLAAWTEGKPELITGRLVIEAAGRGDPLAVEVVQEAGRYLGIAVAHIVNLFNPSLVVIGGDVLELGDLFIDPVRETMTSQAFSVSLGYVQIVPSELGYQAAAIGAATVVIDSFFSYAGTISRQHRPVKEVVITG